MDYYDKNIAKDIDIQIPIYLNVGKEFPDLVEATQFRVDQELDREGISGWHLHIITGGQEEDSSNYDNDSNYNIYLHQADEAEYIVSETTKDIFIGYNLLLVSAGGVPDLVTGVLLDHVFAQEIEAFRALTKGDNYSSKVVAYSPLYHLTFSLFCGDGDPIEWDIGEALETHFSPLRQLLGEKVANLTIDTQVQYYSSLSFELPERAGTNGPIELDNTHLSTFVNFADWSLTSIHSYPTLHFILYVPAKDQSPMQIKDSKSNSFSIPQWGGVVVKDRPSNNGHFTSEDLLPILETFSSQFLGLLGAPTVPKSPAIRIDFLSRISAVRALLSSSSTLGSLYRLSQSLSNIAIPAPVLYSVEDTLSSIQSSLLSLSNGNWNGAVKKAGDALTRSQSAFFDKMMVQQMYFPDEHKVAIYLPLLGPVAVVMGLGILRVLKEFKSGE